MWRVRSPTTSPRASRARPSKCSRSGTHKSKILSANVWLTDIRNRDEMNAAWTAWADPANLPARATVEAKLADPQMLVEIMVTCAK